jgi:hypothetical protein
MKLLLVSVGVTILGFILAIIFSVETDGGNCLSNCTVLEVTSYTYAGIVVLVTGVICGQVGWLRIRRTTNDRGFSDNR